MQFHCTASVAPSSLTRCGNRDFVAARLAEHLPQLRLNPSQGTYLLWLNCRAPGMNDAQLRKFFVKEAKVGMNPGTAFMRINIASPRHVIDPRKALTELHIRDQDGQIRSEIDTYVILMSRVPRLRPLAWLIGLPLLKSLFGSLYRWMVRRRLRRQGRIGLRPAVAPCCAPRNALSFAHDYIVSPQKSTKIL